MVDACRGATMMKRRRRKLGKSRRRRRSGMAVDGAVPGLIWIQRP